MGRITFILGGARSGKSTYALKLTREGNRKVAFIATATEGDAEMAQRIAVHRRERPPHWTTLEIPYDIAAALKANPVETDIVLLDCLTLLVTNLIMQAGDPEQSGQELTAADESQVTGRVVAEMSGIIETAQETKANWIIVSNEVGLGLVPPYPMGRLYRDLLGRANQLMASQADEVIWMVAGIPVPIQQFRKVEG